MTGWASPLGSVPTQQGMDPQRGDRLIRLSFRTPLSQVRAAVHASTVRWRGICAGSDVSPRSPGSSTSATPLDNPHVIQGYFTTAISLGRHVLREERLKRAVEAQDREPALFRIGLYPVAPLDPCGLGRTEVDRR